MKECFSMLSLLSECNCGGQLSYCVPVSTFAEALKLSALRFTVVLSGVLVHVFMAFLWLCKVSNI